MSHTPETEDVLRRHLATNVRTRRLAAGLTLKTASERSAMHWRFWQKIEACGVTVTLYTLTRLSKTLGVTSAELLSEP